ncbi:hypothetical protein BD289DRAFT_486747 [Coniella lustricola]|uniref:MIT domain-containing protein n=1 Tax=Coniella lustricola TaxID=2025994 RepID=A0A2T2ZU48_9PEZI|nr:hypothetical protein BD289DRAFT_486747 [Coniella lustricola]
MSSPHVVYAQPKPPHAAASTSAAAAAATALPASAYNFHLNAAAAAAASSSSSSTASHAHTRRPQQPLYDSSVPVSRTLYGSYGSAYPLSSSSSSSSSATHKQSSFSAAPSSSASALHISSALHYAARPESPLVSPAALPRASSLLPPPRITVNENQNSSSSNSNSSSSRKNSRPQPPLYDPFYAANTAIPDPVTARDDEPISPRNVPPRRGSRTHSRSSSLGGLSDGFRNLNRWSVSTASSRASNATPVTKSRFSRRLSIDSTTLFSQSPTSPRRLHKNRLPPSTASIGQSQSSIPPLESLPPIVTLPSLDQEDFGQAVLARQENNTTSARGHGRVPSLGQPSPYRSMSAARATTPDPTLPRSAFNRDFANSGTMSQSEDASPVFVRGHQRGRSQGFKSSTDSAASPKSRVKQPSQKAMLSKALQKANAAVQLDNAQNFDAARSAYCEACDLLQQVLERTPGNEDKKKLDAIRRTYSSRVDELDEMIPKDMDEGKALPQTPRSASTGYRTRAASAASTNDGYSLPMRQRSDTGRSQQSVPNYARPTSAAWRTQMTLDSPKGAYDSARGYGATTPVPPTIPSTASTSYGDHERSQSSVSQRSPQRKPSLDPDIFLARPMQDEYMPPPLSPRRPISPTRSSSRAGADLLLQHDHVANNKNRLAPDATVKRGHQRSDSHESISWLDPIDESGGSSASSVHSRSSSIGIRRKHIRAPSGDTEAEFDAALDDAIEAAYDDGYEPAQLEQEDAMAEALKKVQLAKERVRESEMEMHKLAQVRDQRMRALQEEDEEQTLAEGFYNGTDSEDEEHILDRVTERYALGNPTLRKASKASVQRVSESSEPASRTWHSTTASTSAAHSTGLSTVSEVTTALSMAPPSGPLAPPPTSALPKLPPQRPGSSNGRDSVRDRRLSGQNAKQLKIETQQLGPKPPREPVTAGPTMQNTDLPPSTQTKMAGLIAQQRQTLAAAPSRSMSTHRGPSPIPAGLTSEGAPPTPPIPSGVSVDSDSRPATSNPTRPSLRKNYSSTSLKNSKTRQLSISNNLDDFSDISPGTPLANPFVSAAAARLPALPSLATPVASAFRDRLTSASGGYHLFDADIRSPRSPTEPTATMAEGAPVPLEPCPKETLLRPFWLMRALYQTLCHPKGGYVSNKLFMPRDAWSTKGVKIKNVEEKMSQCDLLTAALQKLDRVNSDDADAVLEEMQSFEAVLEQVQMLLTRRLGNEVGVQGAGSLFKDADGAVDGIDGAGLGNGGKTIPRNNSVSAKGTFSWKRLRNKTSSTAISNSYQGSNSGNGPGGLVAVATAAGRKESIAAGLGPGGMGAMDAATTLATLPFTDFPTSKPSKRDVASVSFSGPNAQYMAALAKLFDAAQSIDQIARQVEDPGLRHQDKTQVGLELSTRHAAEFFAFYICRFVLQDMAMLLDKFIKRGSEWVLV